MNETEPVSDIRTPTETVGLGMSAPGSSAGRVARFGRRFRGLRVLKEGNGIVTYLGTDIANDQPVIIKAAVPGTLSASSQMRLEHEAEVLRALRSPYMGSLLAVGREQGALYLVLPQIPGLTLEQRLKTARLDVGETLTVARCLLIALQEAHDHGILHRDVKPANLIVDEGRPIQRAMLIDFGLSRSGRLDPSIRDVPAGTARYMAPEQAGLLHTDVDERADLYAVGVVLFECLAGQPLFTGDTLGEVLRQHLTARPPELRELGLSVPRALDEIIGRLLRKDPRERYQTADGVLADIETLSRALEAGDRDPALILGCHDHRCILTEPSFVGRETELTVLDTALDGARRAQGGLVLLEAESGTGKTRLMTELARRSTQQGIWVLRGQGIDMAAQRPFQLLDGIVAGLATAARNDPALPAAIVARLGDQVDAVCDALPRLREVLATGNREGLGPEVFGEVRSLRALVALLDALGTPDRPALVLLDDCQWGDELAVKLLQQWQNRSGPERPPQLHILIIAGFRSEEVSRQHGLRRIRQTVHVRLAPIGPADVCRLAESMAGKLPDDALHLIQQLAGGSPFMAGAVLRGLVETGALRAEAGGWQLEPQALADVQSSRQAAALLGQRLRLLPPATLRLLAVAAVLGKEFELDLAARLAEQTPHEALEALHTARRRHIVWTRDGDGQYAFTHDKLREALLDGLEQKDRAQLHRAAALSLEEKDRERVFDLAYHFDAAGDSARALPYAMAAAKQARTQHALAIAEQQYRIAERSAVQAEADMRQQIGEHLGEVLMLRGRYREAEAQFATARSLACTGLAQARIARNFGELAIKSGELEAAGQALESGLRLLGRAVPRNRAWVYLFLGWEALIQILHTWLPRWFVGRRPRQGADEELLAIALYNSLAYVYYFERGAAACLWTHLRGMNLAERYPPTPELALAYSSHAPAMAMVPLVQRGVSYAQRSLAIRRELGDVWGEGQSLHFYGSVLYTASRFEESLDLSRQAVRILERTGDRWEMNIAGCHVAYNLYRLGEMAEAVAEAQRVYQASMAIGDHQSAGVSLSIHTKAARGRVPAELIRAALERCGKDAHTRAELLMAEGMRQLALDCPTEAVRALEEADRRVRAQGLREEFTAAVVPWLTTALRRELEATPLTAARRRRALLRRAWKTARRAHRRAWFFRNNLPHALREMGYLAAIRGRPRQARRWLDQSLATAERHGARFEQALTLQARGQIGRLLQWPDADNNAERAATLLRELQPPEENAAKSTAPVTLSLADRFDTVLTTGRQIASALSPQAVYAAVQEGAQRLLRGDGCVVLEVREGADGLDAVPVVAATTPVSRSLVQRALATGRPVQFDGDAGVEASDSVVLAGFRSALYTPFSVRGKPAGCFCVTHRQVGGLFGKDEERLAEFIATVAGAALENAEGFARLQQWNAELESRVAERTAAAEERARELARALTNVKTLNGLLPICASCKMIRDDQGYWHQVELYIKEHSAADFSHGICPGCAARFFPSEGMEAESAEIS